MAITAFACRSIDCLILTQLILVDVCAAERELSRVERIRAEMNDAASDHVLVVAHRGDWHRQPENSLSAIRSCLEMGVDIIELDVRLSKDGVPIVMHDTSVDRTTDHKGAISNYTVAELTNMRLRERKGKTIDGLFEPLTDETVPTLREALLLVKGRALINADKAYPIMREIIAVAKQTDTLDHLIFKGWVVAKMDGEDPKHSAAFMQSVDPARAAAQIRTLGEPLIFMPIVGFKDQANSFRDEDYEAARAFVVDCCDELRPPMIEVVFRHDMNPLMDPELVALARKKGSRIWVNTLWDSICGGRDDADALTDPDGVWGWHLERGATVIQTDYPRELLAYLKEKGRR